MNAQAPNPFTGLKGALAGLMSGGLLGLLLSLLFRRRIAPMLEALEDLFARFKAGTLPLPIAPAPTLAKKPAASPTASGATSGARRTRGPSRPRTRQPVAHTTATPAPAATWHQPSVPRAPTQYAQRPSRRRARCTKNLENQAQLRTP